MFTIIITGGTGLIGSSLSKRLAAKGHQIIILSREPRKSADKNISFATWDINAQTIDETAIKSADYIIHLAGAGVAEKRWTEARKKEIVDSRTKSGALLSKTLKEVPNKIQAVISASAIGWYGDDKRLQKHKQAFTEEMPADDSFLGETCKLWEESLQPVKQLGKRLVYLRTGIVLSKDGGALPEFIKPVNFGIAGFLGGGKQVISWIHIEDLCRMFEFAVDQNDVSGIYNAVAPEPVTNKELTLELAGRIRGKFFVSMHVPAFVVKAMVGGMSIEILKSTTVSCEKIKSEGFQFIYPSLATALNNLVKK